MKMKSIARTPFKYAGALVQPHAEFSVKSERDAKMLAAVKRAALLVEAPKPAPAPQAKSTYKRRDMIAERPVEPVSAPLEQAAWPFTDPKKPTA